MILSVKIDINNYAGKLPALGEEKPEEELMGKFCYTHSMGIIIKNYS